MPCPLRESFHPGDIFADVVTTDVVGALLTEGERLTFDIDDEPLAEIFELQGKGPLALQQHINRAALAVAEGIFQSDLLVRIQAPNLYRRSEEHTSDLQSLMRISYAVFCLKKKH